ncbi:unnamed protein product [Phytophthora lilii]|uniref:Unnamed protein product n=1 Tax=Phytophthora lilii TaxID=2077276 RepID=A0A9W7D1L2_9STRA|nr:unnamed protein product [Phytophthora lilii]
MKFSCCIGYVDLVDIDVREAKKDAALFTCITDAEWELAVEMEAIVHRVAELALVESQAANMLSSTLYVVLRVASARMNSYQRAADQLNCPRDEDTYEVNFPRVELTFSNISDLGHRCITRTLHQIAKRLPKPSTSMGVALQLTPPPPPNKALGKKLPPLTRYTRGVH